MRDAGVTAFDYTGRIPSSAARQRVATERVVGSQGQAGEGIVEGEVCTGQRPDAAGVSVPGLNLTTIDRERLTFFKWRYILQADGFAVAQARRLTFMRWLYLQGRLVE